MSRTRGYGYQTPRWGSGEDGVNGREARESRRGFRWFVGLVTVSFAVAMAVVVGHRLSDQAISILAGAACGVGASIPTSLLIVWVTQRRREEEKPSREPERPASGAYPPVVVVQPPAQMGAGQGQAGGYLPPYGSSYPGTMPPSMREFTVVGNGMERERDRRRW